MRIRPDILRALASLFLSLALLAGCSTAATPSPVPPSATRPARTPTRVFTSTAVPATRAPLRRASPRAFTPTPTLPPAGAPTITLTPGYVIVSAGRIIAPILMYHHINDRDTTPYATTVAAFRAQMKALRAAGYQAITISHLARVIREGGDLPEKPVIITFDDGYLDVYENAFPIMREYGYTGVTYIITSTLDKGKTYGYMQVDQLKELSASGWEIGSHSINHLNLTTSPAGFSQEVEGSWQVLEEKFSVPVRSFSYPFAASNRWIEDQVAKYGYDTAVGVGTFVSHSEKSLYYLSRREVPRGISLEAFLALLVPNESELALATQSAQTPSP